MAAHAEFVTALIQKLLSCVDFLRLLFGIRMMVILIGRYSQYRYVVDGI